MLPPVFAQLQTSAQVRSLLGSPMRVYRHGEASQRVAKPYVTWQLVGAAPENELSGLPCADRLPLQIDCWDETDAGIVVLAKAVRDAIEPVAHMVAVVADGKESATKLYRFGMQFDWWLSR